MTLRILFATNNKHKVLEASIVLKEFGIEVVPINAKKLEIQSDDLKEIAMFAARTAFKEVGKPVVVEDAGLFIWALKGFPGPYSSYVYKTIGLQGILKLMENIEDRRATFISFVALALDEKRVLVFRGEVHGYISREIRGSKGFGFDPIFLPEGCNRTFAEMDVEEKCRISHRARAFRALGSWLAKNKDKLIHLL